MTFDIDAYIDELAAEAEADPRTAELREVQARQAAEAAELRESQAAQDAADASVADAIAVMDGPVDLADFIENLDQDGTTAGAITFAIANAVSAGSIRLNRTVNEYGEVEKQTIVPNV